MSLLRRRPKAGDRRILFPVLGATVSRAALDATLRLSVAENATLVPVYLATVPHHLTLDAAIPAREGDLALPLLELIEQRATRRGVPVDSRIERGRTARHALTAALERERYDSIVVPARTSGSDGFSPDDVAWLLETAPCEVFVLRPNEKRDR